MEGRRFTTVIDLTQKAQREKKQEQEMQEMAEPENALPPARLSKLPEKVQSACSAAGWNRLMPVQERTIPYLLGRRDVIVQSRTGSGKTGAFLLPLFEMLDSDRAETQALILTPTRELARQIYEEFERMKLATPETNDLRGALIYGGVKYQPQIRALKRGAHVVIGTPGRILDHLEKQVFSLQGLNVLVFDEADEMLSMGFYPAMRQLKRYLPRKRLSTMFSATIPAKVRSLAREFLDDPAFLSLSGTQISVDTIEHRYYVVNQMEKDRALASIIEMENPDSAIIFSNTKREVEYLATFLKNYGYDVDAISGDLSQQAREDVMDKIRRGDLRFLVATDVAARGIDISDLTHVIMYDVPQDPEYYVHRAGRTARAGKTGTAIVFATVSDERSLLSITNRYGIEIVKEPVPEPSEVSARVAQRMTVILESRMREKSNLEKERLQRFIPLVSELAQEEPELLAMLIDSLYMQQLHSRPDVVAPEPPPRERGERERGDRERGDRERGESERGDRERGDRERGDRERGDRERPEREQRPPRTPQPDQAAAGEPMGEEEPRKKRKKKRKKKRNRGNREEGTQAPQPEAASPEATAGPTPVTPEAPQAADVAPSIEAPPVEVAPEGEEERNKSRKSRRAEGAPAAEAPAEAPEPAAEAAEPEKPKRGTRKPKAKPASNEAAEALEPPPLETEPEAGKAPANKAPARKSRAKKPQADEAQTEEAKAEKPKRGARKPKGGAAEGGETQDGTPAE